MKALKYTAIVSSILGALCLAVSTYFGGTMFGYMNTDSLLVYRLQHLFPLTYCFGAAVIYCAWRMGSRFFAVVGLLEMLFLPLILGVIFYSPDQMWIQG